ncbi:MAG: ribosome silencing factor [Dehalococcoidia bacterium]|nr:ribosome silencing factor [Dehalococcoidia bacterium]
MPYTRPARPPPEEASLQGSELAHEIVDVLVDRQAEDVVLLDMTSLSVFADYFVIATVDNPRQARAVVDAVEAHVLADGRSRPKVEGAADSSWILVDLGEGIFVHVFTEDSRAFYNLEGLWNRAQEVVRVQ